MKRRIFLLLVRILRLLAIASSVWLFSFAVTFYFVGAPLNVLMIAGAAICICVALIAENIEFQWRSG